MRIHLNLFLTLVCIFISSGFQCSHMKVRADFVTPSVVPTKVIMISSEVSQEEVVSNFSAWMKTHKSDFKEILASSSTDGTPIRYVESKESLNLKNIVDNSKIEYKKNHCFEYIIDLDFFFYTENVSHVFCVYRTAENKSTVIEYVSPEGLQEKEINLFYNLKDFLAKEFETGQVKFGDKFEVSSSDGINFSIGR